MCANSSPRGGGGREDPEVAGGLDLVGSKGEPPARELVGPKELKKLPNELSSAVI